MIFKRKRQSEQNQIKKCKPHNVQMKITLKDVYNGLIKSCQYQKRIICQGCRGTGANNISGKFTCPRCKGKGKKLVIERLANVLFQREDKCNVCCGEGELIKDKCGYCKGERIVFVSDQVEIKIEKGIMDGYCYEFNEFGDEYPGYEKGDLIVQILIEKDKNFIRKNANLIIKHKISIIQALAGPQLLIDHLNGKKVLIKTKKGEVIKPGMRECVEKMGMPHLENPSRYGDLIIEYEVEFPDKISDVQNKGLNQVLIRLNLIDI
jgi:DnaJ-class molecular chaperone